MCQVPMYLAVLHTPNSIPLIYICLPRSLCSILSFLNIKNKILTYLQLTQEVASPTLKQLCSLSHDSINKHLKPYHVHHN